MLKNITFSADENIIKKARQKALKNKKTLNIVFRCWLESYVKDSMNSVNYVDLMKKLKHIKAGKHFSRDEMNER